MRFTGISHLAAGTLVALLVPVAAFAQSNDLRATIRAQILKDPRSAQMTSAEVDAMVTALSQGAQEKGMTANDITWRPQTSIPSSQSAPTATTSACFGMPDFVCAVQRGLGFDGSNTYIPLGFFVTSGLLSVLLVMLKRQNKKYGAPIAAR